jgi:site-specific recombinase XerD
MRRLRAIAGVPDDAKLYGTRHAFGVRSVLNGVDLKTLAELMGHTSTRTTEHYLYHLVGHRGHLADAMRQANGRRPAS